MPKATLTSVYRYDLTYDHGADEGVTHLKRYSNIDDVEMLFREARHRGEAQFSDELNRKFLLRYRRGEYHLERLWAGTPTEQLSTSPRRNPLQ